MKYNVTIINEANNQIIADLPAMTFEDLHFLLQQHARPDDNVLLNAYDWLKGHGWVKIRGLKVKESWVKRFTINLFKFDDPRYRFDIVAIEEDTTNLMAGNEVVTSLSEELDWNPGDEFVKEPDPMTPKNFNTTLIAVHTGMFVFNREDIDEETLANTLKRFYTMSEKDVERFFNCLDTSRPSIIREYAYNEAPYSLHVQKKG